MKSGKNESASPSEKKPIQAVILAGGLGTRLGELGKDTPKLLVPIQGKPFAEYQLSLLEKNGVRHALYLTGHLHHKIKEYFDAHPHPKIKISLAHEAELLGTGGAIKNALPLLESQFAVLYGDGYLLQEFSRPLSFFRKSGAESLMVVRENSRGKEKSNCRIAGGMVVQYEKGTDNPALSHIDYGLNFFHRRSFESFPEKKFDLGELHRAIIARKSLAAFETALDYFEVGSPKGIKEFEEHILRGGAKQ